MTEATVCEFPERRIDEAWPDDAEGAQGAEGAERGRRRRRGARGHVDFPSSEGALMSISFLTFAVFLIKLIMVGTCLSAQDPRGTLNTIGNTVASLSLYYT